MRLHREGWSTLIMVLLLLASVYYSILMLLGPPLWLLVALAIVALVFFGFCVNFFRNPKVQVQHDESLVLAPANGKVVVIEPTHEPEVLKDQRIQISIFMSPLDVHVNRNPVSGKLAFAKHHPGKYLVAWHPKSSTENERTTLVYQMADNTRILLRQIAGSVARRIRCYALEGEEVQQGEEFGFIKFGSRVDVFLPMDAEVLVEVDQISKAGRTVLARLS